jgi:hypothetical protein
MITSMSTSTRPAGGRMPLGAWPPRTGRARRRARIDIALGVAVALVVLALAPGLAVVAVVALVAIAGCLLSLLLRRRPLARLTRRRG